MLIHLEFLCVNKNNFFWTKIEFFRNFYRRATSFEEGGKSQQRRSGKESRNNGLPPRLCGDSFAPEVNVFEKGLKGIASLLVWPPERCDPWEKHYPCGPALFI